MTAREYYKQKYNTEPCERSECMMSVKEVLDLQDEFLQAVTQANDPQMSDKCDDLIAFMHYWNDTPDSLIEEFRIYQYIKQLNSNCG